MPPQTIYPDPKQSKNSGPSSTPPPAPHPGGQFDFILTDPKKPKTRFGLPSNLPKPALILIPLVMVLIVALILGSLLGGGSNNSTQIIDLLSQNQEIIRISSTYQKDITDNADLNLSATTIASLTSQQTQFSAYLATKKVKAKPAQLAANLNKNTDTALQNALLINQFDSSYITYLNSALQKYQTSISSTAKAGSKNFSKVLEAAYASNKVLLSSSQFTSNPPS